MQNLNKQQALSRNRGRILEGLHLLVWESDFCLSTFELRRIRHSCRDKRVEGWLFAYQAYASPDKTRNKLLKQNIRHPNPRIREQVCDIIGDEFIYELRCELKKLFNDPVPYVAEAARYNHDEMF